MTARTLTEELGFDPAAISSIGESWKVRCVRATRGNQSLLGAILLACLGYAPDNPPRIVSAAEVDAEGWVLAFFQKRGEDGATVTRVCHIDDLVANFRGLADALKLSDADAKALFFELRAWVSKDHRAEPSFLG